MSQFLKEMIIRRLKALTEGELLKYAHQYGFSISESEASQIVQYIKHNPIDPFHASGRLVLLKELSHITDIKTAQQAQQLFNKMIQTYGLDHLFE